MFQSQLYKELSLDQVRYSLVWEDHLLLEESYEFKPTDRVLSIASSGCNCLNLALKNPKEIIALDMNPFQLDLLQLKIQMIKELSYPDFISLLNLQSDNNFTVSKFDRIVQKLSPDLGKKLTQSLPQIQLGLLSFGRLEQYFKLFREQYLNKIWSEQVRTHLKNCKNTTEQMKLIKENNFAQLAQAAEVFFSLEGLAKGRSEAQLKYVTIKNSGPLFFQKFLDQLQNTLIHENFYLHFFIYGFAPDNQKFWLPYLQEKNFQSLKTNVNKIQLVQSDIESFLQSSESFDFYNLSDIFEYMSPEHSDKLFAVINEKLTPKGKIAYWTLLVERQSTNLKRLEKMSEKLFSKDRLFFYSSFNVYEKLN